jgi:ABC-type glycerol-3-phosphate transport system permease component
MQRGQLHRMRQSGWFAILMLALAAAAIAACAWGIGTVSYQRTIAGFTAEVTEYERKASMGFFAGARGTFRTLAILFGGISAAGLAYMRFITPMVRANARRQAVTRNIRLGLQYFAALLMTAVMLFPIYWMIISSFKTSAELLQPVPTLWPQHFQGLDNYIAVMNRAPFGLYFSNTIISTFFIMIAQLLIGVFAAYGFSKGKSRGKDVFFIIVLGALMVPIQVTFVPVYVMISKLGWINTFPALIVPNLVSAYFIFMLRQTFMAVDNSYLEAGKVDGMGRIGSIFYVLIPMCRPTLITVGIITFINGWNSYFWPKMVTTKDARRTIAVGINHLRRTFAGVEVSNYNEIMAGAVLAIVPIVILFLFLQKYIMTGMSKAAMK